MEADVLAYLDQLHEQATALGTAETRNKARDKFVKIILHEWPAISAILPAHDHSL